MRPEPVVDPDPLDYRATIVICFAAAGLSFKFFQGSDLSVLLMDYPRWPEEPWRLLTACLVHADWMHLLFNLYWTWRFGQILEPIFGLFAMIGIYVFLAAGTSASEWAVSSGAIGLSGVGYGLFGLCWALHRFHPGYRGVMDEHTTRLFIGWFFFCIVATFLDWMPIANVAHGMGAVLGGLLGLSLSPFPKRSKPGRIGLATVVPLIVVLSTVGRPYVNFSRQRGWELFYDSFAAFEDEDFPGAARLLEQSVERDPGNPDAWHNLGYAYQELGLWDESTQAMAREEEVLRAREAEDESHERSLVDEFQDRIHKSVDEKK